MKDLKQSLKQLLCNHKNKDYEVICWHWTHGKSPNNDPLFIQMQLKCKHCGAYYLTYIKDRKICDKFAETYKDKRWTETCQPEWKYICIG